MTREFEVIYQETGREGLLSLTLKAGNEKEARKVLAGMDRVVVHRILETRVVISEGQVYFRIEEAAEFLRCGASRIYELMEDGKLPKAKDGNPIFHRSQLDAVAKMMMTKVDFKAEARS